MNINADENRIRANDAEKSDLLESILVNDK
jgi:hypothetical protein